jgi:hypothetical protein
MGECISGALISLLLPHTQDTVSSAIILQIKTQHYYMLQFHLMQIGQKLSDAGEEDKKNGCSS